MSDYGTSASGKMEYMSFLLFWSLKTLDVTHRTKTQKLWKVERGELIDGPLQGAYNSHPMVPFSTEGRLVSFEPAGWLAWANTQGVKGKAVGGLSPCWKENCKWGRLELSLGDVAPVRLRVGAAATLELQWTLFSPVVFVLPIISLRRQKGHRKLEFDVIRLIHETTCCKRKRKYIYFVFL